MMFSLVWPWYAAIIFIIVCIPFSFWALSVYDSIWQAAIAFLAGTAALIFVSLGLMISVGRHYDRINCKNFSAQTNRQVKFVIYSTFSCDCLTPTNKRKWISTDNLREFGD